MGPSEPRERANASGGDKGLSRPLAGATARGAARSPDHDAIRNRMLAVITSVLVVAGLQAGYSVAMPLAIAIIVIAAIWPVKPWLDRVLPSSLSYVCTVLVLLLAFVAFTAALYFSAAQVVQAFSRNWDRFNQIYATVTEWAARFGLPNLGGQEFYARLMGFGQSLLSNTYTVLVYLGFVAIMVILGLPQVPVLRQKLRDELTAPERRELLDTIDEIAEQIRQYLGITVLTSAITGLACAGFAFAVGLELALVWGILNFLLNFIPVIGNVIAIIPPSLYSVVQFPDWTTRGLVLLGFSLIHIVIANFVYPALQGRSLSLSPVAIIVALAFWTWLWGIPGALIAVPLTAALVIVCEHFRSTTWIAKLLSG